MEKSYAHPRNISTCIRCETSESRLHPAYCSKCSFIIYSSSQLTTEDAELRSTIDGNSAGCGCCLALRLVARGGTEIGGTKSICKSARENTDEIGKVGNLMVKSQRFGRGGQGFVANETNTTIPNGVQDGEDQGRAQRGAKGAMAPPKKFEFILSKLRFRDGSAIFVEKPKGTTFGKKFGPPQKKILCTPLPWLPCYRSRLRDAFT